MYEPNVRELEERVERLEAQMRDVKEAQRLAAQMFKELNARTPARPRI